MTGIVVASTRTEVQSIIIHFSQVVHRLLEALIGQVTVPSCDVGDQRGALPEPGEVEINGGVLSIGGKGQAIQREEVQAVVPVVLGPDRLDQPEDSSVLGILG